MLNFLVDWLSLHSHRSKRRIAVFIDILIAIFSVYFAISVARSELLLPNQSDIIAMILAAALVYVSFLYFRVYRAIIRHLDISTVFSIVISVLVASLIWTAVVKFIWDNEQLLSIHFLNQWLVCTILIVGYRLVLHWVFRVQGEGALNKETCAIYGTSKAARRLSEALRLSDKYQPIFFVTEDEAFAGGRVNGLRVYHMDKLWWAIKRFGVKTIMICVEDESDEKRRALSKQFLSMGLTIRIQPTVDQSLRLGNAQSVLRNLEISDLISRQSVPPVAELLSSAVVGKSILVTGAAGSIGSKLCARIMQLAPRALYIVDFDENGLRELYNEFSKQDNVKVKMFLGSITNVDFVKRIFNSRQFDCIFHAAAYKHVAMGEMNPAGMMHNNITGTKNLVDVAVSQKVQKFVLISTDKAVNPVSVMGASKRWCEQIVLSGGKTLKNEYDNASYCCVRFGNVIESSGSVVPLFKKQISEGGPVTITDNRMHRYFMSLDEAVDLILQASALSEGGDLFTLDMGEQVSIREVAKTLIQLAGLSLKSAENPDGDIEIIETGMRPGEKLVEELHAKDVVLMSTEHPFISLSLADPVTSKSVSRNLTELQSLLQDENIDEAKRLLFSIVVN